MARLHKLSGEGYLLIEDLVLLRALREPDRFSLGFSALASGAHSSDRDACGVPGYLVLPWWPEGLS